MRVIANGRLKKFRGQPGHGDSRGSLQSWCDAAIKAAWTSPQAVNLHCANASICSNNRVVFNVVGNKSRPGVELQYRAGIAWVKFIGTHAQYERIDVKTVNDHKAHSQRRRPSCDIPPS